MKKMMVALLAGAMLMLTAGMASAYTIDYSSTAIVNDFFTGLTLNNQKVETFNRTTLGILPSTGFDQTTWSWSGLGQIFDGTANGSGTNPNTSSPFGLSMRDQTKYLSVPNPNSTGSASLKLDSTYDTFGLWWGSVDTYNTISFKNGGIATGDSFTGSVVAPPANGDQTVSATNLFVNFVGLAKFDEVVFKSTNWAFEFDNVTVGNTAPVPEPGTMMLLGLGLGGLAIFGKRRMNKEA